MIAVDTSVCVAAFASWHEGHEAALAAMKRHPRLPSHAAVETYSVLTRLPPPHRVDAELAASLLDTFFRRPYLVLPATAYAALIRETADVGITGGAVYDALIAVTVREARATLLSRDRRAAAVYDLLGVSYELLK
ncbi:MAG TPA: type II toxin-antitoxin system VapC family toxin [Thermoanaerobaculia bacterium]|nr:type II toxin-antitoxin system VapC family toxin [Thermoanaerobaculia bacterium]